MILSLLSRHRNLKPLHRHVLKPGNLLNDLFLFNFLSLLTALVLVAFVFFPSSTKLVPREANALNPQLPASFLLALS